MTSTNHPNRGRGSPSRNPQAADITTMRESVGLSVKEAADLVHTTYRAWLQWESGDRRMHPAFLDLFNRKIARMPKVVPQAAEVAGG